MVRLLAILFPLLLVLSGCWDLKSIANTDYFTALGFDYKDDQYVIYAQMLDFSKVAKQEGGKPSRAGGVWTGRAEGRTMSDAIDSLFKTAQQRVFYGHISAIVFTENALKHGIHSYLDGLIRFRETRYTQWVYGTKEPIDQVFSVTPFFNLSPLASILHTPIETYIQQSDIRPLRLFKVVTELREPGQTLLLPSLEIVEDQWKKDERADPKLATGGVFAIKDGSLQGWLDYKKLVGVRWVEQSSVHASVTIEQNGKPAANISIRNMKAKIVPHANGNKAGFSIRFTCKAAINALLQPIDEESIRQETAREIRTQLEQTFQAGKKQSIDVYTLEHVLYHDAFPAWSRLTSNGSMPLRDYSLDSVEIEVKLVHSGMFKNKEEGRQY
ncbi:Ger(x)C family spore germination protein [Paenibacillus sp. HJGM_3]|uniref:Ger(x)C family spore germination protein n=1 Tax=Paenibacillus sp. HJGM_3 TaxID=3379816 RepID=UPI00385AF14A